MDQQEDDSILESVHRRYHESLTPSMDEWYQQSSPNTQRTSLLSCQIVARGCAAILLLDKGYRPLRIHIQSSLTSERNQVISPP